MDAVGAGMDARAAAGAAVGAEAGMGAVGAAVLLAYFLARGPEKVRDIA